MFGDNYPFPRKPLLTFATPFYMCNFLSQFITSIFFAPTVTSVGLIFDIYGAYLVAVELRNVFEGQTTFNIAPIGGSVHSWTNPKFVEHEQKKRKTMKLGLNFLFLGFMLQGIGVWLPYCKV